MTPHSDAECPCSTDMATQQTGKAQACCTHEKHLILVVLARLAPETVETSARALIRSISGLLSPGDGQEPPKIRSFLSFGRYELIAIVKAAPSRLRLFRGLPHINGVKKVDIQVCYSCCTDVTPWFAVDQPDGIAPLMTASYVRIREDMLLQYGLKAKRAVRRHLSSSLGAAVGNGAEPLVLTSFGWPCFVVLMRGHDAGRLIETAADTLWSLNVGRMSQTWADFGLPDAHDDCEPVFCRTLSAVSYDMPQPGKKPDWNAVAGDLIAPFATGRVHVGRDRRVADMAEGLGWPEPVQATPLLNIGEEDMALHFHGGGGDEYPSVKAGPFLRVYCELQQAVASDVYATELHLQTSSRDDQCALRVTHHPPDEIRLPRFIHTHQGSSALSSLTAALTGLFRQANWAADNDGLFSTIGDQYLHAEWLARHLDSPAVEMEMTEGYTALEHCAQEIADFADGFGQRLDGSYYGLMSYGPASLVEYMGSMHMLFSVLWGIQQACVSLFDRAESVHVPRGYWLVSKGRPAAAVTGSGSFIGRLPALGMFNPVDALFEIGHEIGHMVYHKWWETMLQTAWVAEMARMVRAGDNDGDLLADALDYVASTTSSHMPEVFSDVFSTVAFANGDYARPLQCFQEIEPWYGRRDDGIEAAGIHLRAWVVWRLAKGERGLIPDDVLGAAEPFPAGDDHLTRQALQAWLLESCREADIELGESHPGILSRQSISESARIWIKERIATPESLQLYRRAVGWAIVAASEVRGSDNRVSLEWRDQALAGLDELSPAGAGVLDSIDALESIWDASTRYLGEQLTARHYRTEIED